MRYKFLEIEKEECSVEDDFVYDLSVEDDESYCVSDRKIIVHNCTTYNQTGVGTPMYSLVSECAAESKIPLIADGGIREIGDVSKALHAGAKMVMVGSMFAACKDSPAPTKFRGKKVFYGSASERNKGSRDYIEGASTILDEKEYTMIELHHRFEQGIQSSMSYAGATDPYGIRKMQARLTL